MTELTIDMPIVRRRGLIDPDSFDGENMTVEVTWSTGSESIEVEPFDHPFIERLSFQPEHVDLERFKSGTAPVLDSHAAWELDKQLGVIEDAWLEEVSDVPGQTDARCRIKLSRRDTPQMRGILQDIRDKIVRNVSVGYKVTRYRDVTEPEDLLPVRLAIGWQPFELSLVPSGEDPGAHLRASKNQTTTCTLENFTGPDPMGKKKTTAGESGAGNENENPVLVERQRGIDIRNAVRDAGLDLEYADELIELDEDEAPISVDRARALIQVRLDEEEPAEQTGGKPAVSGSVTAAEAAQVERRRGIAIREMVAVANLDSEYADELIAMNNRGGRPLSVERCRALVFDKLAEQGKGESNMNGGHTRVASVGEEAWSKARSGMLNALEVRCGVTQDNGESVVLTEHGRNFSGMRLDRMAEEFFTVGGHAEHVRGKSADDIATFTLIRSRAMGPMHGTTDFGSLLENVVGKNLRKAYSGAPSDWRDFCTKSSASDYKTMTRVQLGEYPALTKVRPGAEYEMGTIGESGESYAVFKYGKRIAFTRELMINDDLNALNRLPQLAGRSASELEADIIWAIITDNATMSDGVALFAAGHSNVGTGLIDKAGLNAGRKAMRLQTGIDGQRIGVKPTFLVVPAELETEAEEMTASISPVTSGGVNPFATAFRKIIVEPRLDANSTAEWYMFADPGMIDVIEYAYLLGNEGPMIETREGFEIDGMEMKVRHEFGAAALDHPRRLPFRRSSLSNKPHPSSLGGGASSHRGPQRYSKRQNEHLEHHEECSQQRLDVGFHRGSRDRIGRHGPGWDPADRRGRRGRERRRGRGQHPRGLHPALPVHGRDHRRRKPVLG